MRALRLAGIVTALVALALYSPHGG